jgi:hypothetical protein
MRVRLAYATSGDGPALVKAANWLTHLDYDWASPGLVALVAPPEPEPLLGWAVWQAMPPWIR